MALARQPWTVGIDFGGTNIKAGLVNASGRVVATELFSSPEATRPKAFVERVADAVASCGIKRRRLKRAEAVKEGQKALRASHNIEPLEVEGSRLEATARLEPRTSSRERERPEVCVIGALNLLPPLKPSQTFV